MTDQQLYIPAKAARKMLSDKGYRVKTWKGLTNAMARFGIDGAIRGKEMTYPLHLVKEIPSAA